MDPIGSPLEVVSVVFVAGVALIAVIWRSSWVSSLGGKFGREGLNLERYPMAGRPTCKLSMLVLSNHRSAEDVQVLQLILNTSSFIVRRKNRGY